MGSTFADEKWISKKLHLVYFKEYFEELGAKTIVVEEDYIDRDYLEDYAAYYDRCFQNYGRRTLRLHFFDLEFDEEVFVTAVTAGEGCAQEKSLQDAYLGFVVVKPLPQSVVGRTCLRTYPNDGGRRHFPCLRTYDVNLFGMQLKVRSLAYQEQDTVVAACATSALWSCLQGTGKLFQHPIPPPVEITNWAAEHMPENLGAVSSRAFPNNGLTASQMAYAVRRVGLEPMVIGSPARYDLNGLAYAFLRGRIPSVLVYTLKEWDGEKLKEVGQHAVAVTGYSLDEGPPIPHLRTGLQLRSTRIDKLYGHDDQVGPFARMIWNPPVDGGFGVAHPGDFNLLKTSGSDQIFAEINFVLLPLYHKIRIPYSLIHDTVFSLDKFIEQARRGRVAKGEWDIFLTTANDYKISARSDYPAWGIDPAATLYKSLPRFMWRVLLRVNNKVELDILFDATGIAQHSLVVHQVAQGGYKSMLEQLARVRVKKGLDVDVQVAAVLEQFAPAWVGEAGGAIKGVARNVETAVATEGGAANH